MANDFLQNLFQGVDLAQAPSDITGTDPFTQQALLQLGAQLMQPVQPGQTPAGHFGQAAMSSLDTFNKQRAAQRTAQAAQAKFALEQDRFGLEQEKAASLSELQKAQAGYYGRMPQAKGEGSAAAIEQRNKNWETARKLATDRLAQMIEAGADLDQIKNYDPSIEARIIYYRDFATTDERKAMDKEYKAWLKRKQEQAAAAPAPTEPGKPKRVKEPPPASLEEAMERTRAQAAEREQREAEAKTVDLRARRLRALRNQVFSRPISDPSAILEELRTEWANYDESQRKMATDIVQKLGQ